MEKFALLNLLKALGSLNSAQGGESSENQTPPAQAKAASSAPSAAPPFEINTYPNVMASVLERHEQISNRVRNLSHKKV